ncbi:MAG TPA: BatA domain-containing protein [Gemmataceae bacterium]|nr:BatA domain-containing protein [Gemmataceae bacterium]
MLSSFFLNPWMLIGLSAILIPPIIHLLNRRRYEAVDWGAIQFLQMSEVTRRRLFIEELLLMLLRMGLIAVLVLALAGPFITSSSLARLAPRANRDVVLVFDGSYSMGSTGKDGVPQEKAKEWARAFVADLTPGDSVAILQAKEQVVPVLAEPSHYPARVRQHIEELPAPAGGCDWRPALQEAAAILSRSQRAEREIILLSDGQRFGWADRESLFRWAFLASSLSSEYRVLSSENNQNSELRTQNSELRFWVVNVAAEREADPPNWSLTPLETNRLLAPVGREVVFRTAMDLHGQKTYTPPHRVRLEVDGRFVRNLDVPRTAQLQNGRVPFSFTQAFAAPGSHLVSVILEADPPAEQRAASYTVKDQLPGDNRQDFAIEVVRALPLLIVDGDSEAKGQEHVDFLRQALEARDPKPVVRTRVVPINEFDPVLLAAPETNKADESAIRPRVLILRDVPRLTTAQQEAIGQFLADGGGVLATLGPRTEADAYNVQLYRGGKGWLPAHLDGIEPSTGETPAPLRPEDAAYPAPGGSDHPALRLFVEKPKDGQGPARFPQLGRVRFSHWWKLAVGPAGPVGPASRRSSSEVGPASRRWVQVAALRTAAAEYPFLVEWIDPNRAGRLLQCAVPFDDSWGPELIRSESFLPLAHELVYYLAGARSAEFNLEPGQPLRYRLDSTGVIEQLKLQTPLNVTKPLSTNPADKNAFLAAVDRLPQGSMLRIEGTRETGVYRLHTVEDDTIYYVVRPRMAEESDLTPCNDEDRAKVAKLIPGMKYQNDREKLAEEWISEQHRQELWWWLLLGLIALLCGEVWLTRRIVKNR